MFIEMKKLSHLSERKRQKINDKRRDDAGFEKNNN
jgi:hypothetical protein